MATHQETSPRLPEAWIPTENGRPYPTLNIKPAAAAKTIYEDENVVELPVYKPSWEEFKNFYQFVKSIEPMGMACGIVKVIPPKEWTEQLNGDLSTALEKIRIEGALRQTWEPTGRAGAQTYFQEAARDEEQVWSVREWADMCNQAPHRPRPAAYFVRELRKYNIKMPTSRSSRKGKLAQRGWDYRNAWLDGYRDKQDVAPDGSLFDQDDFCTAVSAEYWDSLVKDAVSELPGRPKKHAWYGADQEDTLFPTSLKVWNLDRLDSLLSRANNAIGPDGEWRENRGSSIPGITSSYVYFGSYRASFGWHTEDYDMHSINYIHFGAPKIWYAIAAEDREDFEKIVAANWPEEAEECPEFMRHKHFLGDPTDGRIKRRRMVQRAGEFIITFPKGYHSGFNMGFNCAEAANFATEAWMPYGLKARVCKCSETVDQAAELNIHLMLQEALKEECDRANRAIMEKENLVLSVGDNPSAEQHAAVKAQIADLKASLESMRALLEQSTQKIADLETRLGQKKQVRKKARMSKKELLQRFHGHPAEMQWFTMPRNGSGHSAPPTDSIGQEEYPRLRKQKVDTGTSVKSMQEKRKDIEAEARKRMHWLAKHHKTTAKNFRKAVEAYAVAAQSGEPVASGSNGTPTEQLDESDADPRMLSTDRLRRAKRTASIVVPETESEEEEGLSS